MLRIVTFDRAPRVIHNLMKYPCVRLTHSGEDHGLGGNSIGLRYRTNQVFLNPRIIGHGPCLKYSTLPLLMRISSVPRVFLPNVGIAIASRVASCLLTVRVIWGTN